MIKFTASNIVSLILFIPIILVLGIILAFIVPVLAIIFSLLGILLTSVYFCGRIILGKREKNIGIKEPSKKGLIEVKQYKIR
jgi:hypothetical protein